MKVEHFTNQDFVELIKHTGITPQLVKSVSYDASDDVAVLEVFVTDNGNHLIVNDEVVTTFIGVPVLRD